MAGIRRISRATPPTTGDLASVRVELAGERGRNVALGTALEALRDPRLTAAERAAIHALVRAVQLLRTRARMAGIDDAGTGVKLILRDKDATSHGPWATTGSISVGTRNGLASRSGGRANPNVLITVDAAVHELTHVAQFARMNENATPNGAILEGVADTVAMLATNDDTLGEEFFLRDANGRYRGAIRELGQHTTSGAPVGPVVKHYHDAISPSTEDHAAGGVVSAAFALVRSSLGRERAEQLVWAVIRDRSAWVTGGSWRELVLAIRRAAATIWPADAAAAHAVEGALQRTGLNAAVAGLV
jgi:hypothetical protein